MGAMQDFKAGAVTAIQPATKQRQAAGQTGTAGKHRQVHN
jgi:hypothetical protein